MSSKDTLLSIHTIDNVDVMLTCTNALVDSLEEWVKTIRGALMSGNIFKGIVEEICYSYKSSANYHIIKFTGYDYGTDYIIYDEAEGTISTKPRYCRGGLEDLIQVSIPIPDDIAEMMQTTLYYVEAWRNWRARQHDRTE